MEQTPLKSETALIAAPYQLSYRTVPQNPKENSDGTPRSPLTENSGSTTSSQESTTIELLEPIAARNWLMSNGSQSYGRDYFLDFSSSSPGDNSERSRCHNLGLSFAELPSPSIMIQDRLRGGQRSRLNRGIPASSHLLSQGAHRRGSNSYRHLFKQVTKVGSGQSLTDMGIPESALTVEHLVVLVKSLPPHQSVIQAVLQGLHYMDSRAVAALFKEINKSGLPQRAIEIFDWLRSLDCSHELHHLCDVYTYTTVISLCGPRQSLRLALELVAEMKGRGVHCNVHTYSALMNVCIKCGELELALDVFDQLKREECVPNVVTFNTLVDVYGKLGRWEDAIGVIDQVYQSGLEPEARTFNTVIIAANICNQPLAALKVYQQMVDSGLQPTDTTFTALISAYGKAGQLENAMKIFDRMVQENFERNIITYGSLISACEKAGKWELALQLLENMQQDRVPPNTVTFNALLSACAQGGQSEKAEALFHSMLGRRCKPDTSAYSSVLIAHIRAKHWRAALQAFESMPAGTAPELWLYAELVQCLWDSGVYSAQSSAVKLVTHGIHNRILPPSVQQSPGDNHTLEVKILAANSCIAVCALITWLRELSDLIDRDVSPFLGQSGCSISVKEHIELGTVSSDATAAVQEICSAVATVLDSLQSPFRFDNAAPELTLAAESWRVKEWLQAVSVKSAVAAYLPPVLQDSRSVYESIACRTIAAQEASGNTRLAEAHGLFCQAEQHQEATMAAAQVLYHGIRDDCVQLAKELARYANLPAEAVYSARVLMDYALQAGMPFDREGQASLLVASCLTLAANGLGRQASVQNFGLETILNLAAGSLRPTIDQLKQRRITEMPIASPMTALSQYLNHLMQDSTLEYIRPIVSASPRASRIVGSSNKVLTAAMTHASTQRIRPSLLAAAALAVDRRNRGVLPMWPASLQLWTGISAAPSGAGVLEAAIQLVAAVPVPSAGEFSA